MSTADRLQLAKDRLEAYYRAELAVLSGQEYRLKTRTLRRADLAAIRKAIDGLESQVQRLEEELSGNTAARARRVVIRDI